MAIIQKKPNDGVGIVDTLQDAPALTVTHGRVPNHHPTCYYSSSTGHGNDDGYTLRANLHDAPASVIARKPRLQLAICECGPFGTSGSEVRAIILMYVDPRR